MTTNSVAGLRRSSKAFPKDKLAQTHTKKFIVTVWWSDASLIHYRFLNPGETITSEKYAQQINEIHQKLRCLRPTLVNTEGPVLLHSNAWPHVIQPTLEKLKKLGYKVLPHPPYSPDLLPSNYHFFKCLDNFLQRKYFHNQQDAEKCFPRVHSTPGHRFLHYRNKQTFLIAKNVLILMVLILISKDMFEPSCCC